MLIQLGDIGDVVLSLPVVRTLRKNYPRAKLMVAVREKAAELIEDCSWADGVISINKEQRKWHQEIAHQKNFFLQLWKHGFDLAMDLRTDSRGAILSLLSGARQRIGFYAMDGTLWRNRCYTHLAFLEGQPGQHMAAYYLRLPITYGLNTENVWPELTVPRKKLESAAALFRKENIPLKRCVVAVQPFSLWNYKEWSTAKYTRLIKWIQSEYQLPVVVTGSYEERRRADEIVKHCGANVYNLAGKTSIGMFAAVLKLCGLFVGGDSAGIHIAAAAGTPTVSIFGPSSAVVWAPRGTQHRIVQKDLSCVPCDRKGCQGNEISRCIDELGVEEVVAVVRDQLESILQQVQ